ncbi:hypothetical protein HPB47_013995 [Ixodes persulcatus]|uniref:Uncharacterized protein n=1 Tax=Ixodes persulcatus TaxID=34615 RepID=A0AC60QX24_IXOPE|nr:hypothetical protein HPB47_013995 [Ixodes persulcatus]
MQQRLGMTTAGLDRILLRELFFQRLSTSVGMVLTSIGETNLCKLAELADRLMAVPPSAVSAVLAEPATPDQLQENRAEISHLTDAVAALRASDSRPSSQGNTPRPQQRFCCYHRTYSKAARNCVPPCEHSLGNGRRRH